MKAAYVNNHKQRKSLIKLFLENILYNIRWLINNLKKWEKCRTVLLYPQYPSRRAVIYKILRSLNYNITNNPGKKHHLAIYWDNTTYRKPDEKIVKLINEKFVINQNSRDISKSMVEKVFNSVFGYTYSINCKTYKGLLVKKSEANASHDGQIIMGPAEPEAGFVYQKLINNSYDDELVVDMRVLIINGNIPFVYIKHKAKATRFSPYRKSKHKRKKVEVKSAKQLFSNNEIDKIISFSGKIGLDYGELDILRDVDDEKIYIIDVNNTPCGPPKLQKKLKTKCIHRLGTFFENEFVNPAHSKKQAQLEKEPITV